VRQFKELKGICVGKCIDKNDTIDGTYPRAEAHSHCYWLDPYRGWICLLEEQTLKNDGMLLHEIAHLIVDKFGDLRLHSKEFNKVCKEIGGIKSRAVT
jgi:hypothetical protein